MTLTKKTFFCVAISVLIFLCGLYPTYKKANADLASDLSDFESSITMSNGASISFLISETPSGDYYIKIRWKVQYSISEFEVLNADSITCLFKLYQYQENFDIATATAVYSVQSSVNDNVVSCSTFENEMYGGFYGFLNVNMVDRTNLEQVYLPSFTICVTISGTDYTYTADNFIATNYGYFARSVESVATSALADIEAEYTADEIDILNIVVGGDYSDYIADLKDYYTNQLGDAYDDYVATNSDLSDEIDNLNAENADLRQSNANFLSENSSLVSVRDSINKTLGSDFSITQIFTILLGIIPIVLVLVGIIVLFGKKKRRR